MGWKRFDLRLERMQKVNIMEESVKESELKTENEKLKRQNKELRLRLKIATQKREIDILTNAVQDQEQKK